MQRQRRKLTVEDRVAIDLRRQDGRGMPDRRSAVNPARFQRAPAVRAEGG